MTVFVDTNVLVYARDAADAAKQARAHDWMMRLWDTGEGRLSTQVLNEYYTTVTRKLTPGMAVPDARADIESLTTWDPRPVDTDVIRRSWTVEDQFGFTVWDALIVGAALEAGCSHLLTEDLQAGQDLGGLLVVDPFEIEPNSLTN